ncbi:MAG TPA: gliding motility-associated ABC transporter substrate-binding protein GldG, partial [Chitinophagaceae bacterium]
SIEVYVPADSATGRQGGVQRASFIDSLTTFYGLTPSAVSAPDEVGDDLAIKSVIHGATVNYRDRTIAVDLLKGARAYGTSQEELAALYNDVEATVEYKFASAIQKVTQQEKPVVAYALGHGEAWGFNIDDAVRTLISEYTFDTINLKQVPYIPAQINALIILKPTQPFSDAEKLKIDQYVMNGGKVMWMIDNVYAEFDSLYKSGGFVAFDRGLNLEDLLFTYGARINQSLLQDMQSDQLPQMSGEGDAQQRRLVQWPFFPILNGTNHPISKNLNGVRSMFPTTIDTVEAAGIRKTFLLESSNNARVLPAPAKIDFEFLDIAPDEKMFNQKQVPVAVLLEGRFRSLYTGRLPRATADSMRQWNQQFRTNSEADNKMIIVADGDIAINQYSEFSGPLPMGMNLFTQYSYANKDFYQNALEYLVNPSDILQTRAKEFTLRLLDPKRTKEEKTKWQMINIGLPIAIIILFGLIYHYIRRNRYTVKTT